MNFEKTCFHCKNAPTNGIQPIQAYACKEYINGYIKYDCPHWKDQFVEFKTIEALSEEEE